MIKPITVSVELLRGLVMFAPDEVKSQLEALIASVDEYGNTHVVMFVVK